MDRRIVAGLVGLMLAVSVEESAGQSPGRDPSAQPPVGLVPIPSIGASINNSSISNGVQMAPSDVPTSPVNRGPAAVIPSPPVSSSPVSMTPIEPIHVTINRGFGTGRIAAMFRRPGARPLASPGTATPGLFAPNPTAAPGPMRSPHLPPGISSTPTARPAPFAGQSPDLPRSQAERVVDLNSEPAAGRPAPFAHDPPPAARPQNQPNERPPNPRPRAEATNAPVYRPIGPATPTPIEPVPTTLDQPSPSPTPEAPPIPPAEVPSSPAPGPSSSSTAQISPPPIGTDPLQGMVPVAAIQGPAVAVQAPPVANQPGPSPIPSVDPEVKQASLDQSAVRLNPTKSKDLPVASRRAAAVGDEIITLNELNNAVNDRLKEFMGSQPPPTDESEQAQLRQLRNQIAASELNRLIEQSLILQEANRKISANPKAKQAFDDFLEKQWKTEELTPLLRKTSSTNVYELRQKLTAEGKSYDAMKEAFRKKAMAQDFLRGAIQNKLTCDLSEMRAYYVEHRQEFDQPARMTWREIEINFAKNPNRVAARKKAEDILARLLRDEDFGTVARATSDGPTASQGGIYVDMQPGSYGIPVVNDELNRIPVGQVSQILEAPGSFHIIRVDSRREKGPLRFDEVQNQIRDKVYARNFQQAIESYLAKLRTKTLIRTMFDNTESDPNIARRIDPAVRAASNR